MSVMIAVHRVRTDPGKSWKVLGTVCCEWVAACARVWLFTHLN